MHVELCLLRRGVLELTIWSDLAACAISGHARLAGALIGTILESNDRLAGLQHTIVKLPLVLTGHLKNILIFIHTVSKIGCAVVKMSKGNKIGHVASRIYWPISKTKIQFKLIQQFT
jgi:hypothetical protein